MKKAIVIGASSGIGRELAKLIASDGYEVGVTARRVELLNELKDELGESIRVKQMDISKHEEAMTQLGELIDEMGGVELVVVCAGTGAENKTLEWQPEKDTIDVNVVGVTAVMNVAMRHFLEKGSGHLVGISSIAALRGGGECPAYNASKAYLSNYLQGLRLMAKSHKKQIFVTDIKPGFVDTAMAQGEGLFWVMPVDKTCKQIYKAIKKRRKERVVTKRWRLIAFFMKRMPN